MWHLRTRCPGGVFTLAGLTLAAVPALAQVPLSCDDVTIDTIATPLEIDRFTFSVVDGENVGIRVARDASSAANFHLDWVVRNNLDAIVAGCGPHYQNGDDCGPLPASGNPYRVEVTELGSDAVGSYRVHFYRPTASQACENVPLSCNQAVAGDFAHDLDRDLYSFNVTDGERVEIALVGASGSLPAVTPGFPAWRLLDASGALVPGCAINYQNGDDCGPLPASGNPYRIETYTGPGARTGGYFVQLHRVSSGFACDEVPLTCRLPVSARIDPPIMDRDLFAFTVADGERVQLTVTSAPVPFRVGWRLLDGSGLRVPGCSSSVQGGERCGPLSASGNPYRIEVLAGNLLEPVFYYVHVDSLSAPCPSPPLTRRYLAEGSTGTFFDMLIALLNVEVAPLAATLRFLKQDGSVITHSVAVEGRSRATVDPETIAGLELASFSTVVESILPLVVDRTMRWDATGYGSHAETATSAPATTWYLAEGSTSGDFTLFYLLQNPNPAAVTATVTYLLPFGQPPIVRSYSLPPSSRTTIPVDTQGPELASTDLSAVVTAPEPIIVERAMYLSRPGQPFTAGHDSTGVTAPALDWFLAEGATGTFFELFILVANPNPTAAEITIDYLLDDGRLFTKPYVVPANGRFTVWVDEEQIPGGSGIKPLANVAVSATVRSTNNLPIIVERSMWWPQPAWYEGHNSPGATATGTTWALAEGEVGGAGGHETYILIANTSSFAGQARVTLFFEDGSTAELTVPLLASSRTNVQVGAQFPMASGRRFGAVVESLGQTPAQIVVERAMYSNAGGVVWAAGTNALATRVP